MPLHRRNSTGQVEGDYLEGITETAEVEEDQDLHEISCSAPKEFLCLRGAQGEHIFDISRTVKLLCSNTSCPLSLFMHAECFEVWQNSLLSLLSKTKEGQKKLRNWSDRQKLQNLWKQQGYSLIAEACACKCGGGSLRKDLSWVPPKSNNSGEPAEFNLSSPLTVFSYPGPNSDSEKQKRKRKKSNKNSKPALTIGLPTFVNGLQVTASYTSRYLTSIPLF